MLNTEWPWVWPQRSRSASVCVSLRTLREGELRQFCVYWTKFFLHSNSNTPRARWSTSFFKMADSMAVKAIYRKLWCNNSADAITCACEYWTLCGSSAQRSCALIPTQWFTTSIGSSRPLFPHSGLPLVLGPLGRYWGGFFPSCPCVCLSVCVSETSSPSCFANFASFDTNFGRHNRHSPRMLNTEWPWVWPQRSRSASVCVSLRTLREGELRQFCVYWTKFFLHSNSNTPRARWSTSFFKMADSMAVKAIYRKLWCNNSADAITCACEYWCNNLMHRNYDAVPFLIHNSHTVAYH